MLTIPNLILGSQSPRRRQLLAELNLPFEVMVRPTDEIVPVGVTAEEAALAIAKEKILAFNELLETHTIITADTIVVLGEEVIGKPMDRVDAIQMISKLVGNKHTVMTAVCIAHHGEIHAFVEKTNVYFAHLSEEEIAYYVDTYQPYDKAGAYGVQEWLGMTTITHIEGDFYNVMGLPVSRLYAKLKQICQ